MQLQNFTLTAGTDRVLSMKAKTPSGAVLSLTGATITWRLSRALGGSVALSKSGTVVSAALGTFTVSLSDADTASLANGNYVHEALITIGSTQYSAVQGAVRVSGSNSVSSSSDGGFADEEDQSVLATDQIYYVRTDGADTNDGLTDTAGGAFRTIQAAVDAYSRLDLAGYTCTIRVADGTYTVGATLRANPKGATASIPLTIQGNTTTPANCVISTTSANCITVSDGARLYIEGVKLQTTSSGNCLHAIRGGEAKFGNVEFGTCAGFHKEANDQGRMYNSGNYTISGGAVAHEHCNNESYIQNLSATVTITGTPAFSSYFVGVATAQVQYVSVTFSGSATGQRFLVHQNGVITAAGQSLTSYIPGNSAGVIDTGGVFTGEGGTAYITAGPAWSSSNFGLAIAIGGSRNNSIGIRDATGSNPWAIANTSGTLSFAKMEAFYGTSSPPDHVLRLVSTGQIRLKTFTVATLPAASAGDVSFATNGRKNGEGAGLGTGVLVFYDGTAWRACDTGATVAA